MGAIVMLQEFEIEQVATRTRELATARRQKGLRTNQEICARDAFVKVKGIHHPEQSTVDKVVSLSLKPKKRPAPRSVLTPELKRQIEIESLQMSNQRRDHLLADL